VEGDRERAAALRAHRVAGVAEHDHVGRCMFRTSIENAAPIANQWVR
jgi:hypothetical protein